MVPTIICFKLYETHKIKNSHCSKMLQGCMNTHSGISKLRNFRILLDSVSSSTILMHNLMSKLKGGKQQK